MSNIDEIFDQLRSDKVTVRKDGRKKIEELLGRDSVEVVFRDKDYTTLFRVAISHDINEVLGRGDLSSAQFFKVVMKHHRQFGDISTERAQLLLKHVVKVLLSSDSFITNTIKSIYFDILIEVVLDLKNGHVLSVESMISLFSYIKESLPATVPGSIGHFNSVRPKVLRAFCKALVCYITDDFLSEIIELCSSIMLGISDAGEESKYSAYIFDSLTYLLDNHGANHYKVIIENIKFPIQKAFQSMLRASQLSFRDSQTRMITSCLTIFQMCSFILQEALVNDVIQQFAITVLSEEYLLPVIKYVLTSSKHMNVEYVFFHYSQDSRVRRLVDLAGMGLAYKERKCLVSSDSALSVLLQRLSTDDGIPIRPRSNVTLTEGYLMLAVSLIRHLENGNVKSKSYFSEDIISQWIKVLSDILVEYSTKASEMQVQGYLAILLRKLARIYFEKLGKNTDTLEDLWIKIVMILLMKDTYFEYIKCPKKNTVGIPFIKLLGYILSKNVFKSNKLSPLRDAIASLPWMIDPRLLDSPDCFEFTLRLIMSEEPELLLKNLCSKNDDAKSMFTSLSKSCASKAYLQYFLVIHHFSSDSRRSKSMNWSLLDTANATRTIFLYLFTTTFSSCRFYKAYDDDDVELDSEYSFWMKDEFPTNTLNFCLDSKPFVSLPTQNSSQNFPNKLMIDDVFSEVDKISEYVYLQLETEIQIRADDVKSIASAMMSCQISAVSIIVACCTIVQEVGDHFPDKVNNEDIVIRSIEILLKLILLVLESFKKSSIQNSYFQEFLTIIATFFQKIYWDHNTKRLFVYNAHIQQLISEAILGFMTSIKSSAMPSRRAEDGGIRQSHSMKPRMVLKDEHKKIMSLLSCCYFLCKPEQGTFDELLAVNKDSKGLFKVWSPIEFRMRLCRDIAKVSYSTELYYFLIQKPWVKMYDTLGYSKVLEVIYFLSKSASFVASGEEDSLPGYVLDCLSLIFCELEILQPKDLLLSLWTTRRNQLLCASNMVSFIPNIKVGDNRIKDKFAVLIKEYLNDSDIRVRLEACSNLPLLFSLYSRHENIYRSFVRNQYELTDEDSILPINFTDKRSRVPFFNVVTICVATLRMGIASPAVLRDAILHLLVVCCSSLKGFREQSSATFECNFMSHFLNYAILWVSENLGYKSTRAFFIDNVRWLVNGWLEASLSLVDFPFKVFEFSGRESFLNIVIPLILPVACLLTPSEFRWRHILELSYVKGYGQEDSGIARLLQDYLTEIKAADIVLSNLSTSLNRNDPTEDARYLREFVDRILTSVTISTLLTAYHSDLLKCIFSFLCFEHVNLLNPSEKLYADFCHGLKGAILFVFSGLKSENKYTVVEDMFASSNIIEIFSLLHARMFLTQSSVCRYGILAGVSFLSTLRLSKENRCIVLNLIFNMLKLFKNDFMAIVLIVHEFSITLSKDLYNAEFSEIIEYAYTVIVSILLSISLCRKERSRETKTESTSMSCFIISNSMIFAIADSDIDKIEDILVQCLETLGYHLRAEDFTDIDTCLSKLGGKDVDTISLLDVIEYFPKKITQALLLNPVPFSFIDLHVNVLGLSHLLSLCVKSFFFFAFQILRLRRAFESNRDHVLADNIWSERADVACSVVSILTELLVSSLEGVDTLKDSILYILGNLGSRDFRTLPHGALSLQCRDPYFSNISNELEIKFELLQRTYQYMWDSCIDVSLTAKLALIELRKGDLLEQFSDKVNGFLSHLYDKNFLFRQNYDLAVYDPVHVASVTENNSWSVRNKKSYDNWIRNLVKTLINDCYIKGNDLNIRGHDLFFASLLHLAFLRTDIAELLFPLIILDLVVSSGLETVQVDFITSKVVSFLLSDETQILMPAASRLGVKTLNLLLKYDIGRFLHSKQSRKRKPQEAQKSIDTSVDRNSVTYNFLLDIDFFVAAKAAYQCGCTSSSLLFYELHIENKKENNDNAEDFDTLHRETPLLLNCLLSIHDFDAVHAINQGTSLDIQSAVFCHGGHWLEALSTQESLIQSRREIPSFYPVVTNALSRLGCDHLLSVYEANSSAVSFFDINEITMTKADYSLRQWPQFLDGLVLDSSTNKILAPMKLLRSNIEHTKFAEMKNHSFDRIREELYDCIRRESANKLMNVLASNQQVIEFVETQTVRIVSTDKRDSRHVQALMSKWSGRLENKSDSIREILNNRLLLVTNLMEQNVCRSQELILLLKQVNKTCKSQATAHSFSPLFYRILSTLETIRPEAPRNMLLKFEIAFEESKLLWTKGLVEIAIKALLQNVISPVRKALDEALDVVMYKTLLSEALLTGGEWLSLRRSAASVDILNDYFKGAREHAVSPKLQLKSSLAFANFSAKLYYEALTRTRSTEWEQENKANENKANEIEKYKKKYSELMGTAEGKKQHEEEAKLIAKHMNYLKKELESDSKEKKLVEESIPKYLLDALESYAYVLRSSSDADTETVFQLVNLWFENIHMPNVNELIRSVVTRDTSYKFIPLTYQIFSRIGSEQHTRFSSVLDEVVVRLCRDHPYHTLTQLFALVHEDRVGKLSSTQDKTHCVSSMRMLNAGKILEKLKSLNAELNKMIESLRVTLLTYDELANTKTDDLKAKKISSQISFRDIQGRGETFCDKIKTMLHGSSTDGKPYILTNIPLVRKDSSYKSIVVFIHEVVDRFSITETGNSRPKIVECIGTDGVIYKQLVKGGDDMRQDAVMQQVFGHVNLIFMKHEATRKRMLGIRTYRILPLTPQTGIMEWVQNAVAFGNYLVDSKSGRGAHSRYYPNDYTNAECREKLIVATDKYRTFMEVCRHFHPAFRFFFIEKFSEASQWMRSRLSYTRSVATSSIVGWVLGIGDRHAQNILIDQTNAEVVHIDFGYVFEQGKYLGIPETVPFRLTRDIVDGFGVNGCEGTFRLCSEIVLEVLRENMSQVITILEVVIHDPLYKWSMSPVEVENRRRKRGSDGTEVFFPLKDGTTREKASEFEENGRQTKLRKDIANRTLMRIRNKLQGFDDSSFSSLSVEGFVQLLITEAQDPRNLCKVFAGWAPWL